MEQRGGCGKGEGAKGRVRQREGAAKGRVWQRGGCEYTLQCKCNVCLLGGKENSRPLFD